MDTPVDPSGVGHHHPVMEARIAALEGDTRDMRASLGRLEISVSRIEETLNGLITTVAVLAERLSGLDLRLTQVEHKLDRLEDKLDETVKVAMSEALGPWQLPAVLGACLGVVAAAVAVSAWVATHFGMMPH